VGAFFRKRISAGNTLVPATGATIGARVQRLLQLGLPSTLPTLVRIGERSLAICLRRPVDVIPEPVRYGERRGAHVSRANSESYSNRRVAQRLCEADVALRIGAFGAGVPAAFQDKPFSLIRRLGGVVQNGPELVDAAQPS
jgi:hypothetical protein